MKRPKRKKILLINDNTLCGEVLKSFFDRENGFQIIDEIATLAKLRLSNNVLHADLFLLSAGFPFEIIIPLIKFLSHKAPNIPVVLFNARNADQVILQCVRYGIKGIVWIFDSSSQLIFVCNKVLGGERCLGLKESQLELTATHHRKSNEYLNKITERELSVLKLFALGYSYKKIGEELSISPRTVESHKNNILAKLHLKSLKELIAYAIKNNLS